MPSPHTAGSKEIHLRWYLLKKLISQV